MKTLFIVATLLASLSLHAQEMPIPCSTYEAEIADFSKEVRKPKFQSEYVAPAKAMAHLTGIIAAAKKHSFSLCLPREAQLRANLAWWWAQGKAGKTVNAERIEATTQELMSLNFKPAREAEIDRSFPLFLALAAGDSRVKISCVELLGTGEVMGDIYSDANIWCKATREVTQGGKPWKQTNIVIFRPPFEEGMNWITVRRIEYREEQIPASR